MTRLSKAAAWTAAAAVPFLLVLLLPRGVAVPAVLVYLIAFFACSYLHVFEDESHRSMLRDAELDALFDNVFSDYEADLSRFPFRAHIFRRSGMFPIEKLEMIYSYRTHATDPDRNIRFHKLFRQARRRLGLANVRKRRRAVLPPRRHCGYKGRLPSSRLARLRHAGSLRRSLHCRFDRWPHNATVSRKTAPSACSLSMPSRAKLPTRCSNSLTSSSKANTRNSPTWPIGPACTSRITS